MTRLLSLIRNEHKIPSNEPMTFGYTAEPFEGSLTSQTVEVAVVGQRQDDTLDKTNTGVFF